MSRSYRHTPKRSYGNSASDKPYKVIWHQMMRAAIRQCLHNADPDKILLPHAREIFSDWDFGRSGKRWFCPKEHPELMRK
jgi:hypothetical protein